MCSFKVSQPFVEIPANSLVAVLSCPTPPEGSSTVIGLPAGESDDFTTTGQSATVASYESEPVKWTALTVFIEEERQC